MITLFLSTLFITVFFTYSYYILAQYQRPIPLKSSNLLLLTAHPDDECMFFGPTLTYLRTFSRKTRIHVLCLSTGNADGLGNIRKKELVHSCQKLDIPASQVKSLDHSELQDGMNNKWSSSVIANDVLTDYIKKHKIDTIVTFDDQGVSGHPNHAAAFMGANEYIQQHHDNIQLYKLKTISLPRKYVATLDLLVMTFQHWIQKSSNQIVLISPPVAYLQTHKAMRQHESQLVWFRWLYVTFSRYMYINELEKVEYL
ncbi:putative N-acetylglucosaminyl-phosphatidylinositol deacetylase [Halteromyces radiatus]|uniref:putative N-acetylglucosaminyl-phosphatidylinositol deacetylase n=1 Tax=Halteromyces radiatus TaxID=101107 RepID=UPI0022204B9F|nr:putative N-acetylglucosaminyl-phosphatidylinositol deacetylase [Halteromyces radiatus]KAI8093131.1 putative N-acetylglucosaminyl-phosphatidylinositol deacetylase [Halteromyces radiatus]